MTDSLGEYDYVIIGAGASAMGLVFGLLESYLNDDNNNNNTNNEKKIPFTVAIIERGFNTNHESTNQLWDWAKASHIPNISTNIHGGNLQHLYNRQIDVCVGQGLGGTTNISAGLVIPPSSDDFINWPPTIRDAIVPSVHTILRTMNKSQSISCYLFDNNEESSNVITSCLPGFNLTTLKKEDEWWEVTSKVSTTYKVPCASKYVRDNNSKIKAIRQNYYTSLLYPLLHENPKILDENNFQIYTNYTAERLLIDTSTKECKSVEVLCNVTGKLFTIQAAKEVIICAGCIETPALLLSSGIGRKQDLQSSNVQSVVSETYPGNVGGNLVDHIVVPRVYIKLPSFMTNDDKPSLNNVKAMSNVEVTTTNTTANGGHVGRGQVLLFDSAVNIDLSPLMTCLCLRFVIPFTNESTTTNQYYFIVAINYILYLMNIVVKQILTLLLSYTPMYFVAKYCITIVTISLTNAKSTGSITLKRRRQQSPPPPTTTLVASSTPAPVTTRRSDFIVDVNLGYLTNPVDMECMMELWKISTGVYPTAGYEIIPASLVYRGSEIHKSRFVSYIQRTVLSYFHYVGTCRMKRNDENNNNGGADWVVNEYFQVRDVKSLRICDASVFPTHISCPPALTCAALGHNLAKILLLNEGRSNSSL